MILKDDSVPEGANVAMDPNLRSAAPGDLIKYQLRGWDDFNRFEQVAIVISVNEGRCECLIMCSDGKLITIGSLIMPDKFIVKI